MSPHHIDIVSRRRLLQFLAASPLFARDALAEGLRPSDPVDWAPRELDTTQRWEIADGLVRRAEAAGAPVIAVTLDVRSSAKWETFVRLWRTDTRECGSCHGLNTYLSRKPNFTGIDLGGVSSTVVTNLTWDLIKRLRDTVKVKLGLKGILAFEDAKLAADAGIDAIVVSNHGGRVEDGVSATIDVLPEIAGGVGRRKPG